MPDALSKKERKARLKANKPSFSVRMQNRGRELLGLGEILLQRPKEFPRALLDLLRRSFRTVWDVRGGGLYACGFAVTFVWLEVSMFVADIVAAEGIGDLFGDGIVGMIVGYFVESITNTVQALIWPVHIIDMAPPYGIIALGILYFVFPRYLKAPLEQWLFDDDERQRRPES